MRKEKKATALLKILCYSKGYEGKTMNYKNTIRGIFKDRPNRFIAHVQIGDQLKLTIRDDGPGIAENDLPHLFDRFYKGKNGNHGLGLSIAKRSMEYMGGDIAAESSPDGAVFTIILPQYCRSFAVEEWTEV